MCTAQGQTWVPGVADGAYWQLLTSAFTHIEVWHIGFNMLALWVLGPQLEMAVGRVRFLALYLLSALAGSTLVYWLADPAGSTIGASGAVFGLMGALLVLAVKVRGDVRGILTWVGINAVITFLFPNISWQGHLGGFLGGALIAAMLVYAPRKRRTAWQVARPRGPHPGPGGRDRGPHRRPLLIDPGRPPSCRSSPHLWSNLCRTTPVLFTANSTTVSSPEMR